MPQTVLFYSVNTLMRVPNFGAELELMKKHLDAGDTVHVIRCTGEMPTCLVNKEHWASRCYLCQSRFKRGINLLPGQVHLLDMMPLSDIDDTPLPKKFNTLQDLLDFEIDGIDLGAAVVASIGGELKDHKFDPVHYADRVYDKLRMAYQVMVTSKYHLLKVQPDKVYMYNGRLADSRPMLKMCITLGIPAYCVERAGSIGKYMLFPNTLSLDIPFFTDVVMGLWGEGKAEKEKEAERFYTDRRGGVEQGQPNFVKDQTKNLVPTALNPSQRNVAIFNSSEYEFVGLPDRQNPVYPDQNVGIEQLVQELPDVQFWLRVHPNITNAQNIQLKELQVIEAKKYSNLHIIWPQSEVDSYALMDACDVTLTFGSTMGVEATYWGKPSIMAGRAFYENLDCSYNVQSHNELITLLQQQNLVPRQKQGALIYAYGLMNMGESFETFQHTALNEGTFMGEDFAHHKHFMDFSKYYLLRKWDKLKKRMTSEREEQLI